MTTLLYNVTIYTMDDAHTTATAIAWDNYRILAVGDKSSIQNKFESNINKINTEIDGNGATVLPGFIDPHIHFFDGAMINGTLDCSPEIIPDISSLIKALKNLAKADTSQAWIVGQGYDPLAYPENKSPDRHDLDKACSDRPLVVFHYSMHECVVNSKALEVLGINRNTPQPHAGKIVKDKTGEPTGRLIEMAEGRVVAKVRDSLIAFTEEAIMNRLKEAQDLLFSFGITRIGDPAVSSSTTAFYERAVSKKVLKVPVVMYPCDDANLFGLPMAKACTPKPSSNGSGLSTGPLKIFLDGADRAAIRINLLQGLQSFLGSVKRCITKASLDPLKLTLRSPFTPKKRHLHFGVMMVPQKEGKRCVKEAISNGYSIAFHAIGNEAVDQAADILEQVQSDECQHPQFPPPRIEHGLFLTQTSISKIKNQKMAVVTQPAFIDHMGSDNVPPLPGFKQLPIRSLLNAGIMVSGSSDWPVVSCNPLLGAQKAVTRLTKKGEAVQKNEAVTTHEAIAMYTRNAAFVLGQTDQVGSLEPGKRADFILLSDNPFPSKGLPLTSISVTQTYLGGEKVFCSSDESLKN